MMNTWSPTDSQINAAASRQPAPCCGDCAAANMGNVGFTLPFDMPDIDQNMLLYAAAAIAAGVVIYQLMSKRKSSRGVAKAKADYARRYAEETGRFPRF